MLGNGILKYRLAASSFYLMQGLIFSAWANRIADIRTKLGLSEADLGTILLGIPLGQMLMMPISGLLVSKFTSKRCILAGSILCPSCLMMINEATGMAWLFLILMLFGVCVNINNIAINTQGVVVERMYGRSIMGAFHGTWSFACFCGGLLAMLLMRLGVGIGAHFAIVAACVAANLCVWWRVLPQGGDNPPRPADAAKTRYMPTPFILLLGVVAFGSMSCEGTMFDWSVIYFRDVVKVPAEISNAGYISFMLAMASGRFLSDHFVNKFGAIAVLRFSGVIITSGMLLAVAMPQPAAATIGFLLVGAGVSSVVPLCFSLSGKSLRIPSGIAIATISSIGFFGFLMGPPLIGFVAAATSLRVSFSIMAVIGLTVSAVAPLLKFRVGDK